MWFTLRNALVAAVLLGFSEAKSIPLDRPSNHIDVGIITLEIGEVYEGPMFPAKAFRTRTSRQVANVVSTSICEIARSPETFNGKMVRIRGQVLIAFEDFELPAENCDGRRIDGVWLEYGRGPKRQPTTWCCGDMVPRDVLAILENTDFRKFHSSLTAQRKESVCEGRQCYVYDVTATLLGRFDFAGDEPCQDNTRACYSGGFGHFGLFRGRLVIRSVSDVMAVPTTPFPGAPLISH